MIIKQAEIFATAVNKSQYPPGNRPEFALSGRSNVGKSSLINSFINRKNLARTSSQPGKTQTLNFYEINKEWFFVDLPGYGYAKSSKADRARWARFIETYLHDRDQDVYKRQAASSAAAVWWSALKRPRYTAMRLTRSGRCFMAMNR